MSDTTTTQVAEPAVIQFHPSLDETRLRAELPIARVTLLEDRAQVRRVGTVSLKAGLNRVAVWNIAPVVQDVSLRAAIEGPAQASARVLDARVRRALRVGYQEKPEAVRGIEQRLTELGRTFHEARDEHTRSQERTAVVVDMMHKAMEEVPQDAAWSLGHPETWRETFEALSQKARTLKAEGRGQRERMRGIAEEAQHLLQKRALLDRPDTRFLCVVEIDVEARADGEGLIAVEYVVPNALWRPFHIAELKGEALTMRAQAAVWQNTGEDWNNVELFFSTARSSLGHEPPKLSDDKLAAKKKDAQVVVQAREVQVQNAGLGRGAKGGPGGGGGSGGPSSVDLPGVDDGGDIQNLRAPTRATLPSDGRPSFIPLFELQSPAQVSLTTMPELDDKVFIKATATHTGKHPLLAGPVELVRASGFVGTTRTLFIAPAEQLALGFGPDADIRVQRTIDSATEKDEVDQWVRRTHAVSIFLSNLAPEEKRVEIQERIPVSEIAHVKVTLVADKTSGAPDVDDNGIVTWKMTVPASGRLRLQLTYVVATAPGVQGV